MHFGDRSSNSLAFYDTGMRRKGGVSTKAAD